MNPFQTTADDGVCMLAAKHFRRQAAKLEAQLEGIRSAEDLEFIHRARVASRRLRAGLRMFQAYLDPKVYARWRKHIRRVTSGLGDARDRDVQIEFLCRMLGELNESSLFPGVARLLTELEKERERLQPTVVKAVDRIERSGVLGAMQAALAEVRSASEEAKPAPRTAAVYRQAQQRINAQLDELLSHESGLTNPAACAEHHAMRIAAKRLRYTLEIVKSAYGKSLDPMIERIKRVQTLLGDIHDCDVWAERLDLFAQRQRERVVDRFGHEGPYNRLSLGIQFLRDSRAGSRELLFRELVDYWSQLECEGVWGELRRLTSLAGEAPAVPAVAADSLGPAANRNGAPERTNGQSREPSLAASMDVLDT